MSVGGISRCSEWFSVDVWSWFVHLPSASLQQNIFKSVNITINQQQTSESNVIDSPTLLLKGSNVR